MPKTLYFNIKCKVKITFLLYVARAKTQKGATEGQALTVWLV